MITKENDLSICHANF